ncbi:MSMEG_0565 family glycosyltransferase [Anthocerotibacter panamensis]|uniref:MSMEG_0565 family glycosyltransferase n=1 Tax=Anthocerotibacter panamensis TaxID=2857077 RepID=UPI001C40461A|nr:MSMEG_0565 family glycosyltransferase [Anthocerotibacter panamensis]
MAELLKVALLTYSTKPRGGVVHTLAVAEALQQWGHQVTVYALDKDGGGFYRPVNCPVQLVPTRPLAVPIEQVVEQRIQEFITYFEHASETYDCYHAQDCISANALAFLRQQGRIPHFLRTVHHIDDFTSPYLQRCQDTSIREPDCCLCVSDHWQAALFQQYQVRALRVSNGVDSARFSSTLKADLRLALGLRGWPIYVTVGGIEPRKNSLVLLQAFIKILKRYPKAQLVIAGGETLFDYDPYRRAFLALVEEAGVGDALVLPGVVAERDMPALYRTADAFVFPSVKEGWGLAVLEALASGIAVITADQPPFTEFLTPEDALLVDPRAPEQLAEAMHTILDREIAQRLTTRGLAVSARYSWSASALTHATIYSAFLATQKENVHARNTLPD